MSKRKICENKQPWTVELIRQYPNMTFDRMQELEVENAQLQEALKDLLDMTLVVDEATVPKCGIKKAPKNQVVYTASISYSRIERARQILKMTHTTTYTGLRDRIDRLEAAMKRAIELYQDTEDRQMLLVLEHALEGKSTRETREKKRQIIDDIEALVKSGFCTLEDITDEIKDELCHLWE